MTPLARLCCALLLSLVAAPLAAQSVGPPGLGHGGPAEPPSVFTPPGFGGGQYTPPPDIEYPDDGTGGDGGGGSVGPGSNAGAVSQGKRSLRGASARGVGASSAPLTGGRGGLGGGSAALTVTVQDDDWARWWETNKFEFINLRRTYDAPLDQQGLRAETPEEREIRMAEVRRLIRDKVVPVCRTLAASDDAAVRGAAVVALGKLRDVEGVDIARELLSDENYDVRRSAMLALGLVDTGRASYMLLNLIDSSDVGKGLLHTESNLSIEDRGTALVTAALRGDRRSEAVVVELLEQREGMNDELLSTVADAAGLMGSVRSIQPLMDLAFDRDRPEYVRSAAATALGRIGDPTVTPALVKLAASQDDLEPKRAAALALGIVAYPSSVPVIDHLTDMLVSESDAPSRHFAAVALGRIGGEHAKQALIAAFQDPAPDMRPWVALGLGLAARPNQDDEIPVMLIERMADESNSDTLGAYAVALGLTRSERGVALLGEIVQESGVRSVAGHAALALGMTGQPTAAPILQDVVRRSSSPVVLRNAALGLGILGDRSSVPALVDLIRTTNNPFVASMAAIGIAFMGDEDAVGPLMQLVEREGPRGVTTTYAVAAMGQLFDVDRRPALSRLAADDNYLTRATAVRNLLALGF